MEPTIGQVRIPIPNVEEVGLQVKQAEGFKTIWADMVRVIGHRNGISIFLGEAFPTPALKTKATELLRFVISPAVAKELSMILAGTVSAWERDYGEILLKAKDAGLEGPEVGQEPTPRTGRPQ